MGAKKSFSSMISPTAFVDPTACIGKGTKIWAFAQVAEHAKIGKNCVLGNGVYIDRYVKIGDRVRIHNKALLYHGLEVGSDVFIGPGACFTNDTWPQSGKARDLSGKSWRVSKGAAIGANATILPGVNIGRGAMVGAGSVVTHDVGDGCLVYGNPARVKGVICRCGKVLNGAVSAKNRMCPSCGRKINLPKENL